MSETRAPGTALCVGIGMAVGMLVGLMPSCSIVNAPGAGETDTTSAVGGAGGGTTSSGGHATTSSGGNTTTSSGGSTTTSSAGGGATGGEGGTGCGPLNTLENCGACGVPCAPQHASGASCATGSCQYAACDASYGSCDQNQANGCETALTSLTNCGGCGVPCAPANADGASCASGTCSYSSCTGTHQNCDQNQPNGCESDSLSDASNCGYCGHVCAGATPDCSGGQCTGPCGTDCWGATGCLTAGGHCIRFTCRAGSSPPTFCSQCMGAGWLEISVDDWLNGGYCADVIAKYRTVEGQTTKCGGAALCCGTSAACGGGDNAWHLSDGVQTHLLGPTLSDYGGDSLTNCAYWNNVDASDYQRITVCRTF